MPSDEQNESERERQLDAIIAEYYRLSDAGGCLDQDDFIQRNPDYASELNDFFSDARLLRSQHHSDPTDDLLGPTIAMGTSLPARLAAGSVLRYFGEFEVLEKLGAGGMGVVYKARQTKLKRIVALKMIRSGELANSSDVKRFEAEAKAAAKLTHPGIVSVHEVGIHGGRHFYTMDFVEGGNLSQLHREGPLPAKHAVKLVRQLAESMHYAHLNGIVHRDLKPANILLTADGEPRITDFGLAKRIREDDESQSPTMTESGQILGTAGYMSPEQASGKSRLVGPSSDIYSLGAVLYALLTSRAPFVGETPSHTMIQVLQNEPVSPRKLNPSVPRDLATICLKCLEKDPCKRYGSAQLLADDLRLFQEAKPVRARPVSSLERSWRWCRRNYLLCALMALALFMVIGLPIASLYQVALAVNGVQDARGPVLSDLISHLHAYPSYLVTPILNRRFDTESDSYRKRNLGFALAAFGKVNSEYLVSIIDSVPDNEAGNLLDALTADRIASLNDLNFEALNCTAEKNWRLKSKVAILALYLGDAQLAADMCQIENRPDPVQRTIFIDEFPKWEGDLKELGDLMKTSKDRGLRSAVLLGVGDLSDQRLRPSDKGAWHALADNWYVSAPDSCTHSAAGWLLRKWKIPQAKISPATNPRNDRDWYMNSQGQTFLQIRAGSFHQLAESNAEARETDVTIKESFWLMDREVSVDQFQLFMADTKLSPASKPVRWSGEFEEISPTANHPIQNVNWYDAVMYCNWLSANEGLLPAYEHNGVKEIFFPDKIENDSWRRVERANGYRLPMEHEWEFACRAGTTTEYACGNDTELLRRYSQYSSSFSIICGAKFPNALGLWDMHGNLYEWCDDRTRPVQRGGSFVGFPDAGRSAFRFKVQPNDRGYNTGFRVARSIGIGGGTPLSQDEVGESTESIIAGHEPPAKNHILKPRRIVHNLQHPIIFQHALDNSLILMAGSLHSIILFDVKMLREVQIFRGHLDMVWSFSLSADGRTVLSGSEDRTLRLWDVASGRELDRSLGDGTFSCVRFSIDGSHVFAADLGGKVNVWRHSSGKLERLLKLDVAVTSVDLAFLPEQKAFVIGSNVGQILLCDAETGDIQKTFEGHSGWVANVAVVNAGDQILSAGHDSTLRLWNVKTGETERIYLGHAGRVNEVEVLPDGKKFVSSGADGTVRLWEIESGRELCRGIGSGELRGLSISSDGKSCLTAGLDGTVWEWELPNLSELSSDSTDEITPLMMASGAFQVDFDEKMRLSFRPTDAFIDVDPVTGDPLYGIEWGPADGLSTIVQHGLSDDSLKINEADAVRQGYRRKRVSTVAIRGVNHHIGLWTKLDTLPQ